MPCTYKRFSFYYAACKYSLLLLSVCTKGQEAFAYKLYLFLRCLPTQPATAFARSQDDEARAASRPLLTRWASRITHWVRADDGMQDFSGKRRLNCNARESTLLILPFVAWGVALIVIYSLSQQQLLGVSSPLSQLNLVNFVAFDTLRVVYAAQVRPRCVERHPCAAWVHCVCSVQRVLCSCCRRPRREADRLVGRLVAGRFDGRA